MTFLGDAPVANNVGLVGDKYDRKVGGDVGRRKQIVEEVAGSVVRLPINDRIHDHKRVRTHRIIYLYHSHNN